MRIIAYGVHDGEEIPIQQWMQRNNVEVTIVTEPLTINTVDFAQGFDGISIKQSAPIPDEIIYQKLASFNIKQISARTTGFDMINLSLADKYKLIVTNVPGYSPNAIAEMALMQTMNLVRKMYITQPKVNRHNFMWKGSLAPEIRTLTVGVIGLGRIGSVYAKLIAGLGANVIGYDILPREENRAFMTYQADLATLLAKADVISIHTPLNDSTNQMINQSTLAMMKPNAYLVNTARGAIVNSVDLINALQKGVIAGAALDTIDCEVGYFEHDYSKKTIDSPELKQLLAMDNVLITPHIAFYTQTALENMVDIGLNSTLDILIKGTSENKIVKDKMRLT